MEEVRYPGSLLLDKVVQQETTDEPFFRSGAEVSGFTLSAAWEQVKGMSLLCSSGTSSLTWEEEKKV